MDRVKTFKMESLKSNLGKDQIQRMIKGRMDFSFVTAYELLKDQKKRELPSIRLRQGWTTNKEDPGWITDPVISNTSRLRGRLGSQGSFGRKFKGTAH